MIISVSRRTDIPAAYSDWFFSRLDEGYALVRNPMNPKQIGRVCLDHDHVDGFVFWTKNPVPMIDRIKLLEDWPYYFQYTLNCYEHDVECGLPDKSSVLVPAFLELARITGPGRVLWRYDPVFLSERYTAQWHKQRFAGLASRLAGFTDVCTVSFIDMYAKTRRNTRNLGVRTAEAAEYRDLLCTLRDIAEENGMQLRTCAEPDIADGTGIPAASCIDAKRLSEISGTVIKAPPDRNQGRSGCTCAASIDIGAYDTCPNSCLYCYANVNHVKAADRAKSQDSSNPLLAGVLRPDDTVRDRHMPLFAVQEP